MPSFGQRRAGRGARRAARPRRPRPAAMLRTAPWQAARRARLGGHQGRALCARARGMQLRGSCCRSGGEFGPHQGPGISAPSTHVGQIAFTGSGLGTGGCAAALLASTSATAADSATSAPAVVVCRARAMLKNSAFPFCWKGVTRAAMAWMTPGHPDTRRMHVPRAAFVRV